MQTVKCIFIYIYMPIVLSGCLFMYLNPIDYRYIYITNEAIQNRYGERTDQLIAEGKKYFVENPLRTQGYDYNVLKLRYFDRGSSQYLGFSLTKEATKDFFKQHSRYQLIQEWNQHLFFVSCNSSVYLRDYELIYAMKMYVYWGIWALGMFLLFLLVLPLYFFPKTSMKLNRKYDVTYYRTVLILFIALNIFIIGGEPLLFPYMSFNSIFDQTASKTINTETGKLLQTVPSVKFIDQDIPKDLRKIGVKSIFIAKSPEFFYEYVRYELNPLMFIFSGNNLSDPKRINSAMTYRKLGDNVWLGQYEDLIKKTQEFNHVRLCYTCIWLLATGGFLWFAWWIRRRQLRQLLTE